MTKLSRRNFVFASAVLLAAGGAVDAAQALPLYIRDKVAQTTAERLANGGLK